MELYYLMKYYPKKTWKREVIITSKEAKKIIHIVPLGVYHDWSPNTLHADSYILNTWKENGHIFQAISKIEKLTFQPNQTEAEILRTCFCKLPKKHK